MVAAAPAASLPARAAGARAVSWRERLPAITLVAVLGYLVVVPLGLLVVASFSPTGLPLDPGWSVENYLRVFRDPGFYRLALTTLEFALGCTLATLIVGGTLAWLVERTDLPLKRLCRILIVVPMVLPPFLLAMGWVLLASPRTGLLTGLLQAVLGLSEAPFTIYSLGGMVFVETLALVPSTFLILSPAFRNMDPALEEAAMTSGASLTQTIRRIFVPLLAPAILAAATYLLMVGCLVFDVPGTLGMPVGIFVMSSRILYLATDQAGGVSAYGLIAVIAMSFLVLLLALAWLYRRMTRAAARFVTVTGKGFRPRQRKLGRAKPVAVAFVAVYFVLAVLLPLAVLGWTSLMPYLTPVRLDALRLVTLENHRAALESARVLHATWNSIWVSMLAATLTCALALAVSWVVHRTRVPGRGAIDALAFMPIAIPGVMIGMALVYVYLTLTFVPVYGTPWILVIAFTTVYLSFA
ncbi:MAG TPA: ABC transporter permease subunit, partial [Casimicrobiaceae bacterium]|nr:ABC transporter permease subunit [Casimicrobiaceae bacterium]